MPLIALHGIRKIRRVYWKKERERELEKERERETERERERERELRKLCSRRNPLWLLQHVRVEYFSILNFTPVWPGARRINLNPSITPGVSSVTPDFDFLVWATRFPSTRYLVWIFVCAKRIHPYARRNSSSLSSFFLRFAHASWEVVHQFWAHSSHIQESKVMEECVNRNRLRNALLRLGKDGLRIIIIIIFFQFIRNR